MLDHHYQSISIFLRRWLLRAYSSELDLQYVLIRLAQVTLGLAIVLSPVRYRFVLVEQSLPPLYKDYTDLLVFLGDIFLAGSLVFWIISLALKPRRLNPGPLILLIPLAGMLVMSVVSAIFSVNPLLSVYHIMRLGLMVGLYLFIVNEVKSLRTILWAVATGIFIQSVVGIMQVLEQHSVGLGVLGELELDPAWSGVSIVWAEGIRSLRAYGLADHPNILGGILAFGIVLLAVWYAASPAGRKLFLASVIFLSLLALIGTFSRSAWLALASGTLVAYGLLLYSRQRQAVWNGLTLIGASLLIMLPFIWHNTGFLGMRLNSNGSFHEVAYEKAAVGERSYLNAAANEIFADHAVTGVGLGTYSVALMKSRPEFLTSYQPPHNVLLNAAAETGIFGALFYFLILIGPWVAMFIYRKRLNFSPSLIAAASALAAVTVVGFFDYYPWLLAAGRFWQWLIWGLWASFFGASLNGVQDG